jgi:ClpP class serine protease
LKYRTGKFVDENLPQIFSADVVTGKKAKEIGLVDEIGMVEEVMKREFGDKVKINDFSKGSKWAALAQQYEASFQSRLMTRVIDHLKI